MLERNAVKIARYVPRGGTFSNGSTLLYKIRNIKTLIKELVASGNKDIYTGWIASKTKDLFYAR